MPHRKNRAGTKRRTAVVVAVASAAVLVGALFITTVAVGVTSAVVDGSSSARVNAGDGKAASADPAGRTAAAPTAAGRPAETPVTTPSSAPTPTVTHKTVQKTTEIAFSSTTVDDPNRDSGTNAVVTAGKNGTATETWDVVFTDGVETGRSLVSTTTSAEPVAEVTAVGTRQQPAAAPEPEPEADATADSGCDPNYEGACVPIDSDVDCAGGSGNGPSYVEGPVQVVGTDIYKLDADHDGIGCE